MDSQDCDDVAALPESILPSVSLETLDSLLEVAKDIDSDESIFLSDLRV